MEKSERANFNLLNLIHDVGSGSDTFSSKPSWIEFATNNRCNLACIMCTQSDEKSKDAMPRGEASRLLDVLLHEASLLTPSAGSEPLLGDFDLMLEKCKQHDVHLNIITNGTLLSEKRFREMAERLQMVQFSFDSHIPDIYERIRKNAKFSKTSDNIRGVLKAAAEYEIPIIFVMVLMADNAEHIPGYIDFIADQGGDRARARVRIQPLLDISSHYAELRVENRFNSDQLAQLVNQGLERAKERGIIYQTDLEPPLNNDFYPISPFKRNVSGDVIVRYLDFIKFKYPHFCHMATHYFKVIPTGEVYPCCRGPVELIMGNILETPFEQIWNGKRYRTFRRRMHKRKYPKCCRNCSVLTGNPHYHKGC